MKTGLKRAFFGEICPLELFDVFQGRPSTYVPVDSISAGKRYPMKKGDMAATASFVCLCGFANAIVFPTLQ